MDQFAYRSLVGGRDLSNHGLRFWVVGQLEVHFPSQRDGAGTGTGTCCKAPGHAKVGAGTGTGRYVVGGTTTELGPGSGGTAQQLLDSAPLIFWTAGSGQESTL